MGLQKIFFKNPKVDAEKQAGKNFALWCVAYVTCFSVAIASV